MRHAVRGLSINAVARLDRVCANGQSPNACILDHPRPPTRLAAGPLDRQFSDPQTINLSLNPLGYVLLTTHTTGPDPDPAGYFPALTGKFASDGPDETSLAYPMPVNAQQLIPLLPGTFKLELAEVAQNCTVGGDNPRTITVTARDTVGSVFDVTCVAR